MKFAHQFISAVALACLSASSLATTVYTSSASFLARVEPGSYTENFDGLGIPPPGPVAFSGGGFAYTISAPNDVYASGAFVGTSLPGDALTVNFSGGNVTAVGANFFAVDFGDAFQSMLMTITLSDGTVETFTPTSIGDSYRGFTSQVGFSSLVLSAPGGTNYAALDNLTVGTAIPEPASWSLAGLALAGVFVARHRKA